MTTKERERRALKQIEEIIASLGGNSYVGTALEGCLDIARENIDNDWSCSMKQRAENAEFAEEQLRDKAAVLLDKVNTLESSIKDLRACLLCDDDLCMLDVLVQDEITRCNNGAADESKAVLEIADPSNADFLAALQAYKVHTKQAKAWTEMQGRMRTAARAIYSARHASNLRED